jgi:alpha-mannosidase
VEMLDTIPENVVLSALYVDGGRVFLRFYECTGKPSVPFQILKGSEDQLIPVNLSGSPVGEPETPVQFTPWQIRTFEFKHRQ